MIPFLRRSAALRGPLGGSRGWTFLWGLLIGLRVLRWLFKPKDEIVHVQAIRPGEALLISGVEREPKVIGGKQSG